MIFVQSNSCRQRSPVPYSRGPSNECVYLAESLHALLALPLVSILDSTVAPGQAVPSMSDMKALVHNYRSIQSPVKIGTLQWKTRKE